MMSDSDSISDSDISQGWTFVGPEGTTDSSDHDSDIIVLRDEDMQNYSGTVLAEMKTETRGDELQSEARAKHSEADSEFSEFCETDFRQKTSSASTDAEGETLNTGPDQLENIGNLPSVEEIEISKVSADDGTSVPLEENQEISSSNLEPIIRDLGAGKCMEMECIENGGARRLNDEESSFDEPLKATAEDVKIVSHWELTDPEELSPDSLLSCRPPANSCSQSDFLASVSEEKAAASANACSNSMLREENIDDGNVNADDEEDEDDEDDDESVMRKFHEATLHGSFNRRPLPVDERNEIQQNREEDEFLPPDIDDRCESDISGIADDSDSDLSSLAGIDDLQLHAGDVVRTYRHQPNPKFNKFLTLITSTAMLFVIGIGVGHYIGSTRESGVHQQQLLHLKMLQDEYFVCLRDIEKLESKLVVAKDSDTQEKLTAVTAVWKKKYEELVLERADLEYKLNQMQDRVKALLSLKENSEECVGNSGKTNEKELSNKLMNLKQEIRDPFGTWHERSFESEVKNNVEPKEIEENSKIEMQYISVTDTLDAPVNSIPENVSEVKAPTALEENVTECRKQVDDLKIVLEKKNLEIGLLRNNANQLAVENSDLKSAIQSQRYKEHPGNLKSVATEEKVAKASRVQGIPGPAHFGNQERKTETKPGEQQHRIEELNSKNQGLNNKQDNKKKSNNQLQRHQSTISLLKFFTDHSLFNSESASSNYDSINNLSSCFAALENVTTGDHSLFDFTSPQLLNKEDMTIKIDLLKDQMEKILKLCQNSVNHEKLVSKGQSKFNKFLKVSSSRQENETLQSRSKHVQTFMKQLKTAMQNVIKSLESYPKTVIVTGDGEKLKNEMKNWVHRVSSSWKKFEGAVSSIRNQKPNRGYNRSEPWQKPDFEEPEVRSSVLRSVGEKANRAFDGNRDHKQTESSSSSHQRYEEFWKWNHFDPDDFLQEGFFEDNQREWHKHQKRLRKIGGRIQRLTEEMLLSMDDDDIEDIYEDIDDFADDVEDREIPEQLRTWLSCQTRWWRSRVHRKHRNEDLVKGCGQQLMHWQLRVLCKEKLGKHNQGQGGHKYHKFCKAVISSQGQDLNRRHFVMDKNLFQQGAERVELSSPKNDDAKRCSVGRPFDLSGDDEVENVTFTDHSAYNLDSWCDHQQPDLPVKSSYFENGQSIPLHIRQTILDHFAPGHKRQHDKSLNCKYSKFMQNDEQWCEK